MGQAIGEMLPAAVGVAISPIPIIAVVLLLVSPRGRTNGPAYLLGQVVGIFAAGAIVLLVAGGVGAGDSGNSRTWLPLVLGLGLLVLAAKQWRGRPQGDESPATPKWMDSIDGFSPAKAFGAGVVLSGLNPKNVILTLAGMASVVAASLPAGEQATALVVFTAIASLGVAIPVVMFFALGERSQPLLSGLREWMGRNTAVIMTVILVLIGVKLIGDAISGFSV